MKSYLYLNELTAAQLNQVGREIKRMHEESTENTKRAVAALRSQADPEPIEEEEVVLKTLSELEIFGRIGP